MPLSIEIHYSDFHESHAYSTGLCKELFTVFHKYPTNGKRCCEVTWSPQQSTFFFYLVINVQHFVVYSFKV